MVKRRTPWTRASAALFDAGVVERGGLRSSAEGRLRDVGPVVDGVSRAVDPMMMKMMMVVVVMMLMMVRIRIRISSRTILILILKN